MPTLVTVAEVKRRLRIPAAITEHDTLIGELIDDAEEEILSEASFASFAVATYSETHDVEWDGTNELRVKNNFLQSVVALTDNGTLLTEGTDFYRTDYSYVRLIGSTAYFTRGRQTIEITYTAGPCVAGSTPADLRKLASLIAMRDFNASPHAGIQEERIGQYAFRAGAGNAATSGVLNDPTEREIEKLMARYRRAFAHTTST